VRQAPIQNVSQVIDTVDLGAGDGMWRGETMEIRGRAAIVTGAAAGSGRAIAERLGAEGAAVVVADVDTEHGKDTARRIGSRGGQSEFVRADVRQDKDVEYLVASALRLFGGLDILVNNAGGGGHIEPHFPDASPRQWGATIDLNLRGAMLATQLALEHMRTKGEGAIVNIASTAGLGFASYHSPEYGAAKAGLIRFTTTLGHLRERMGVRVNCVVPDWIGTERALQELEGMSPDERAEAPTPIPMEEVADAVMKLAREDQLTGRVLVLRAGEAPRLLDPDWRE
jgi:NAD(P)-dependent dehydrogenase (short-subunit alcohol dehydrogenase family)